MHLLDFPCETLPEHLAVDEYLLDRLDDDDLSESLRFWTWASPAIVLGRGSRLEREVNLDACRTDSVPVYRRRSGGGVVLFGPGCLLYSLFLRVDPQRGLGTITEATQTVMQRMADAISTPSQTVEVRGVSDLVIGDRKCSGNAQRWRRRAFLHHGTLLHDFDPTLVGRYLKLPERQPAYRGGRDHREFITNLPIDERALRERVATAWEAEPHEVPVDRDRIAEMVRERYATERWTKHL